MGKLPASPLVIERLGIPEVAGIRLVGYRLSRQGWRLVAGSRKTRGSNNSRIPYLF